MFSVKFLKLLSVQLLIYFFYLQINAYHIVLAFDIETSGSSFTKNGILSIGASLQDDNSNELDNFQVNVSLPENCGYEKDCLENFWLKNTDVYKFVQTNAQLPKQAMTSFCEFLDKVELNHPNVKVVSDNPSFDIAWLNFYLDKYTDRKVLNFSAKGEYRLVWDTHSMQKSLLATQKGDFTSEWNLPEKLGFKSQWTHDHNPLNDARTIADFYNQTVKKMN